MTCASPHKPHKVEGLISIREDNLYHFKCEKNHDNLLVINAFKFELLFESGLCAIKDKYYLESVLSITASLERFYEFFVKIIMKSNGIDFKNIENSFKDMSKMSERQIGAYICLYSIKYQEPPILIKNKCKEFRNNVVHKGYLPNETEVLEYAEEVYYLIKNSYYKLLSDYREIILEYSFEVNESIRENSKDLIKTLKIPITSLSPAFAISHTRALENFKKKTFKECFETILKTSFYG